MTCGEMISPVHKLAIFDPGTCDSTSTTAVSVVSVVPLMIDCACSPMGGATFEHPAINGARAAANSPIRLRFMWRIIGTPHWKTV